MPYPPQKKQHIASGIQPENHNGHQQDNMQNTTYIYPTLTLQIYISTSKISTYINTIHLQTSTLHSHPTHTLLLLHFYFYTSTSTSLKQHLTKHILIYLQTHILEQTYTYTWPNLHLNINKKTNISNIYFTYTTLYLTKLIHIHLNHLYIYLYFTKHILIHEQKYTYTPVKMHQFLQVCKHVVTSLFTCSQQVLFHLLLTTLF